MRFLLLLLVCLVGCHNAAVRPTADMHQQRETARLLSEIDKVVGMPDITKFTEKKLAKTILELRDQEDLITYTYYIDMQGNRNFLGKSIGYGLPYSVQYTNPQKLVDAEQSLGINVIDDSGRIQSMPQADPSGLFMPEGLSATWVMLIGPDGKPHPVYVESEILVSPFPLHDEA